MILTSIFIIFSIILLESILSIDNAIVISTIANKAKPEDREKVIKYGIIGAFLFRGLALFAVSWLMSNPEIGGFAKFLGAIYLIKMGYIIITPEADSIEEGEVPSWLESSLKFLGISGTMFIILEVEIADFIFSIDNLFASVAFTENVKGTIYGYPLNIVLTIIGVFLGIITMRWITVKVMKLIDKYPSLNSSAGIVILLLGVKLLISGIITLLEPNSLSFFQEIINKLIFIANVIKPYTGSHYSDFIFSSVMMLIFIIPLVKQKFQK
jgi:YkoY family integral membrane protein